ncbi:MAG: hypothetical protein EOP67_07955 [Sphingomonas sp.]|nr:MAG: hypothetical protein EOP67_07955 [Sphingomonas sp.]
MTAPDIRARRVGTEGEPVVIIDRFSPDPDALREFAAVQDYRPAGRHYPGIAAPLPCSYIRDQGALIATIAREVFGISAGLSLLEARFSIVTSAPSALSLEQRLPHVDAVEPGRLALIHYLVPGGTGGTAFYRHRSTGFETIDAARRDRYFATLNQNLATYGAPESYIVGDTPLFDRISSVDGMYNRALLYRSRLLHSGTIQDGAPLASDPQTGRLTITGFFAS